MRYLYLDETEFIASKLIGYGVLATDELISDLIIDEALTKLKNDPDINDIITKKIDLLTISNRFFHASSDSKNAHSHICNSINKNLIGVFGSQYFDISKRYNNNIFSTLEHASHLASLSVLNTRHPAKLFFERRKDLNLEKLNTSFQALYEKLSYSAYDTPWLPTFYPKLQFEIVDKKNPGIQCVDFILWATCRYLNHKNDWYNRINATFKTKFNTESDDWKGVDIELKRPLLEPVIYYGVKEFPKDPDSIVNNDMLKNFYLHAEKVNAYYVNNTLPSGINYIQRRIRENFFHIHNSNFSNYIEELISIYLMLFDMIPLIDNTTSKKEKEFLMLSKKYLGLALRHDLIHGVTTKNYYLRIRRHIIKNDISLLNF